MKPGTLQRKDCPTQFQLEAELGYLFERGYLPKDVLVVYVPRANGFGGKLDGWVIYYVSLS